MDHCAIPFKLEIDCSNGNIQSTNFNCVNVSNICELDLSKYEIDPLKSIQITKHGRKPKTNFSVLPANWISGNVYKITCDEGYIHEFSKTNQQKMRCLCKEHDGSYTCRKNRYFGENLGRCIKKTHHDEPGDFNINPNFENSLAKKRLQFRYFMSSLYDTFLYGGTKL